MNNFTPIKPGTPRASLTLFLVDAGGPNDPPYDARLKRALKCLGRRFKLRVRNISSGDLIAGTGRPVPQEASLG